MNSTVTGSVVDPFDTPGTVDAPFSVPTHVRVSGVALKS
jgi:hypothetical protein